MTKKKNRIPPTRERVLELREGADRGYRRTWAEVGAELGVTGDYCSRIARGTVQRMPKVVPDYDPREVYQAYADDLTDEAIEAWRRDRVCLCGCGEPVGRAYGTSVAPYGGYAGFRRGHSRRLPSRRYEIVQIAATIDYSGPKPGNYAPFALMETVDDYCEREGINLRQFAERAKVPVRHLKDIHSPYYRFHVTPLTAAKILHACGEPMPRDVQRAWAQWRREQRDLRQRADN